MKVALLIIIVVIIPLICLGLWLLSNWIGRVKSTDTSERKRIMEMVEAGKIRPDEGKELLNALGNSSALRGQEKFSRPDFAVLAGVGLVVLGFFLPWAYANIFSQVPIYYQSGYNAGTLGWTVFIIAIMSAVPVFVTPKNFLYKILMLQIFLTIIGTVLIISVLIQAGKHAAIGLIICLVGFLVSLAASLSKFRTLAA